MVWLERRYQFLLIFFHGIGVFSSWVVNKQTLINDKKNMKIKINWFLLVYSLIVSATTHAQYTQQLRGTVNDHVLQTPLAGATVTLQPNGQSVITDEQGVFRFRDLPVGSYRLQISFTGFKDVVFDNIAINSGKETVLNLPMEALIRTETAVILKSNSKKNKPLNDMSAVSARAFTVEETQKYAAAVNDPSRMATAFPGVLAADDGNNSIIIRGNSPGGLLWRMEGMDIPNPNHFSITGGSGGGISILNSQLLSNSDFVTAAFAAEYGNAMSGVFDLKLRKGNNEKREYTVQAGVLGLNAAAEGPFSKRYKGSYLINYRYSTLSLLNSIGVVKDGGSTNFQDLSYNIFLPAGKLGTFTLFGFAGKSDDLGKPKIDSSKWEEHDDRYPYTFVANTSMSGLTHTILLGNRMNLKSGIGYSSTRNSYIEDYIKDE
ncbi:MAG: carboxypeptidase regulatory-like domain-containing protein, partial [Chitinophagaceae bacterium]